MKKLLTVTFIILLVSITVLSACAQAPATTRTMTSSSTSRATATTTPMTTFTLPAPTTVTATQMAPPSYTTPVPGIQESGKGVYSTSNDTMGLAVGGAKDINNFRENINNNYLPLPTDITYEGLFYDYYFDTGMTGPADKLFSPSYSYAVTRDPFSGQTDYYLAVGLNSGLQESDFERKKLNLVIVVDISGSMNEEYNRYYYDNLGQLKDIYEAEGISLAKKIDSAQEAVASILDQLDDGDEFAIVTFNSNAFLFQPMTPVRKTNMRSVKDSVYDIIAGGSTNLDAGLELATRQFRGMYELNSYEYENRIIILTDAQPNTGDYSSGGLLGTVASNAQQRIYTTFIGVGVDFNTLLIEQITKIEGANYYSVHSPGDFRERIEDEFDYMVTPLVFDLRLYFEADGWRIAEVFGSPEADEATGELMKVNTMFPSKSEGGETKGGLVLLKLQRTYGNSYPTVYLKASYEDRNGRYDTSEAVVYLDARQPEYFDNNGIRKGVLLSRYACLMKNWLIDERQHLHISYPWEPVVREDTGIIIPPETGFSEWERQSMPLTVSPAYRELFREFGNYFRQEMNAVHDNTLDQELQILNKLS